MENTEEMPKVVELALKMYSTFRSAHSFSKYFVVEETFSLELVHLSYDRRFNFEEAIMRTSLISKPTS